MSVASYLTCVWSFYNRDKYKQNHAKQRHRFTAAQTKVSPLIVFFNSSVISKEKD